jgi:hypothetical protein
MTTMMASAYGMVSGTGGDGLEHFCVVGEQDNFINRAISLWHFCWVYKRRRRQRRRKDGKKEMKKESRKGEEEEEDRMMLIPL